ncbi:hypothetical protein C8K30_101996 [Promicromonospora sp. AC04]|uniref:hypothetical protein n=1 Tax=Promicromonospora sp. AC04 TaxID=2135723 RepID=UPI000D423CEE|nr:hypothetical protein [Promicromonospora sp. AC04]PUB32470.1 hypothetical protein C8K30_101996 [Promicromonospora sp. AC04]
MGFDWESILDTSGTGVAEAYDDVVSQHIDRDDSYAGYSGPVPVGMEQEGAVDR